MRALVRTIATAHPGDMEGLKTFLVDLSIDKIHRLAVIGKTEGAATANDYSRHLAMQAAKDALSDLGGETLKAKSTLIFSTGTEGVSSPCITVIATMKEAEENQRFEPMNEPRLSMGTASSRAISANELHTTAHARIVAAAVGEAIEDAELSPRDVAIVLVKSPLLTQKKAAVQGDVEILNRAGVTGLSRGAAALGVAVALGDLTEGQLSKTRISQDSGAYTNRAMCFSGSEVDVAEVVVLGNRRGVSGHHQVFSAPMADLIDARSLKRLCLEGGCGIDSDGELTGTERIMALFFKAGLSMDGRLRGTRTTIFSSELEPDKHMRAAASGVIGALLGMTRAFVSGGAEHQAAAGGALAAIIVDTSKANNS